VKKVSSSKEIARIVKILTYRDIILAQDEIEALLNKYSRSEDSKSLSCK
jgi:hypothetical protein